MDPYIYLRLVNLASQYSRPGGHGPVIQNRDDGQENGTELVEYEKFNATGKAHTHHQHNHEHH